MEDRILIEVDSFKSTSTYKQLHFVDPKLIMFTPVNDFRANSLHEKVSGGDWDLNLSRFDDCSLIYLAYKHVMVDGGSWEETEFFRGDYQAGIHQLDTSQSSDDDRHRWKILRCRYLEYLFNAMKEFGYIQNPYYDFMSLLIGRNGEIILNNGRHRLAAAKILGIPQIPVLIDVRHDEWVAFKNDVVNYSKQHGGMIYSPFIHFDLKHIPARQKDRRSDILRSISKSTKTVLDLGAQWGLITGFLESKGYSCTAVENDEVELSFLSRIRKMSRCSFRVADEDIYQFIMDVDFGHYDCVLALSIFHHFLKTKAGYGQLVRMLSRIECNEMIFQMPDRDELAKFNPYKNLSCGEFLQFVISYSCLNRHEEIGCQQSRRMFRLWRE